MVRIFGIVVEKNHELPGDHPQGQYKGRAVAGGNDVRDESGNFALFQDLGSRPATMEAAKAADAYGSIEGHDVQQCDAEQAYTQAELKGTPDMGETAPRPMACQLGRDEGPSLPSRARPVRPPGQRRPLGSSLRGMLAEGRLRIDPNLAVMLLAP